MAARSIGLLLAASEESSADGPVLEILAVGRRSPVRCRQRPADAAAITAAERLDSPGNPPGGIRTAAGFPCVRRVLDPLS